MGQIKTVLMPRQRRLLQTLGENIRLARLRRDLTSAMVAERAGISRGTLTRIEKGEGGVSIDVFLKVLTILRLENDLLSIAEADPLGRSLQDLHLNHRKQRASKK